MAEGVELLAAEPARSVLCTDFDGTLAPIVLDPGAAAPLPGAVALLHQLAGKLAAVAVVSGRPASFLSECLGLKTASRLRAFGLYGLEEATPGGARVAALDSPGFDAARWRAVVGTAAEQLRAAAPAGALVEEKGLSIGLHWRTAPAVEDAVTALAGEIAAASRLVVHRGRMALELSPPQSGDKGDVVRMLCAGAAAGCFIGDDLGDLPAFDALDELAAGSTFRAVKVAVASAEAPPALIERSDVVLDGPPAVLALLGELLAAVQRQVPDGG